VRFFCLLLILSFTPLITSFSQHTLSIHEALKLSLNKSMEIKKRTAAIRNAEILLKGASYLPNPHLSYSREDLKSGYFKYGEWSLSGGIPLNFIWNRWSDYSSKEKLLEAQKALYNNTVLNIISDVSRVYLSLRIFDELKIILDSTLNKLFVLSDVAELRLNEGDISEYESQRFKLELSKLKIMFNGISIKRLSYENNLKLLTGIDIYERIVTEPFLNLPEVNLIKEDLINEALKNRSDLYALNLMLESLNDNLSYNRLKGIPQLELSAGYKSQSDDLKGSIIQLELEIPLFNRNQVGVEQSALDISIIKDEISWLEQTIVNQVSEAFDKLEVYKTDLYQREKIKFSELFEIAAYSYAEGETSLIEFFDGINAFFDGMILNSELKINYVESVFNIQKTVQLSITQF
jgi:outer membrane protein TolC